MGLTSRRCDCRAARPKFDNRAWNPAKISDVTGGGLYLFVTPDQSKPSLVAEVKFAEWTSKGELRQPVFLGLSHDKDSKDVVREQERPRK